MKITLSQQLNRMADTKGKFINITKSFESTVIPHKGDFIEDPLWKDPYVYEVSEVIIDYSIDTCFVELFAYQLSSDEDVERMAELAVKFHEWKTAFPINTNYFNKS